MNHSIYSVSFLINEGMETASCSMSNSNKDTDIKVEFIKTVSLTISLNDVNA